ncbi:HAD family hydrolase [Streptomyces sp. NPDC000941]
MTMLGIPDVMCARLFDPDGVLAKTAVVHAAAWKESFDESLRRREGLGCRPLDAAADYEEYVDGRPRADGVRAFLASSCPKARTTTLRSWKSCTVSEPQERPAAGADPRAGRRGVHGLVRYVEAVRVAGLPTVVVSSSANAHDVLASVGIEGLFDVRIDGVVAVERKLPGKQHLDTFLEAAYDRGVEPGAAAVFEDVLVGMEAGRSGHFGYVVGIDRIGQADALRQRGADVVVGDLDELVGDRA